MQNRTTPTPVADPQPEPEPQPEPTTEPEPTPDTVTIPRAVLASLAEHLKIAACQDNAPVFIFPDSALGRAILAAL